MTITLTNRRITILLHIKILIMLLAAIMTLLSCTSKIDKANQGQQSTNSPPSYSMAFTDTLSERTHEEQSSFDALNTLQVSTDKMNHLYSTFADIVQPCYPPDTSFTISRSELLTAMQKFVTKHCTNLAINERNELAATAVLAQEEYIVLYCHENSAIPNYENGLPMTGTWIMPSVLGRRDVILVW